MDWNVAIKINSGIKNMGFFLIHHLKLSFWLHILRNLIQNLQLIQCKITSFKLTPKNLFENIRFILIILMLESQRVEHNIDIIYLYYI